MRWAAVSGASQTMVMRETSGRSDSPTVSETMLMLRRRKSEATRVRTPGLSLTRATKVCSMIDLSKCGISIAFEGQELAAHGDLDAVALGVGLALEGHAEVDGAHDAVAELLMDKLLPGGAVVLHQLVEGIDGWVGGRHDHALAAGGRLAQQGGIGGVELEQRGSAAGLLGG